MKNAMHDASCSGLTQIRSGRAKAYKYRKASYYKVVGVSCDVLYLEKKIVGIELYNKSATRNKKPRNGICSLR